VKVSTKGKDTQIHKHTDTQSMCVLVWGSNTHAYLFWAHPFLARTREHS